MSEETKKQVIEMSAGIAVHNLVLFFICLLWFRSIPVFLGILLGTVCAVLLLCSMAYSTELCVEAAEENYARRKMVTHALIRAAAIFLVLFLIWKFTEINLVALVLGILGLKTGAYLYPVVHKFLNHKAGNKEA